MILRTEQSGRVIAPGAQQKFYRSERFDSDRERVEFLFSLYEKLTAPLLPATPKSRGRRSRPAAATGHPVRPHTLPLPGQNLPDKP
jgi:hypothetical protein